MNNLAKSDISVTIPELTAFLTFNMGGFTGLDPAFASTELALAASSETKTQTFKLTGEGTSRKLFAEVNPDPSKVSFTQSQVVWFIHNCLGQFEDWFGLILLMKSGDNYFTIVVRREGDEDPTIVLCEPDHKTTYQAKDFFYLVTPV